ncbi:MAG: hypothetical protein HC890_00125 [Chloroflexaceae bacterium]|nr:hypothetical protein [Chloroflexaceae bacterium]
MIAMDREINLERKNFMKTAAFKILPRLTRVVVMVCLAVLLVFSQILPAAAVKSYPSNPQEGETVLSDIVRKTEGVADSNPRSEQQMKRDAEGGLNAVQGKADMDKMVTPESAKANSVEGEIREGLRNFLK